MMNDFLWWRDGVIYQIYPRSFADSNGDGLGDLPGVTSRLDYLSDLGVDAIWLSPFYPTPDKDFGYDISEYCDVDPRFGTLADFDRLVTGAHRRGIRVVLDMVMNHTSDQHPWFLESRSSRDNPKRDWFIWRDRPNNWQASFGGKAWTFDPVTGQYFLHLFTPAQPDVNWRNPEVRKAQLDAFRFWLERGVDGFRLDVFNAYFKDDRFRSNPPKFGLRGFDRQEHIHDIDQPEMMPLLDELRALLDSYPERYAVGETYLGAPEKAVSYCGPDKLHAAFSFDFTMPASEAAAALRIHPFNPDWVLQKILEREAAFDAAGVWPTTVMSNHDVMRAASRTCRGADDRMAKLAMALLLTLRGTPFLYYGEEIGMRDLALKRSEIMDPPGKKYWPIYPGRDGCRSPMQWDASPNAGFSSAQPWLKVNPDYPRRNVAAQRADPDSLFNFTKKLIALRKGTPALRGGNFVPLTGCPRGVLAYLRRAAEQTVLVALNFSGRAARLPVPAAAWTPLLSTGALPAEVRTEVRLAPHEVLLLINS
ncbi:MAG: alpha-glucosidase [Anaerolineaceae bacterium]|nr:MAG: alpha-glucosidase [Anaerolineaceae bacterium]